MPKTIVFQGEIGAYSHLACRDFYPDMTPKPCASFADAFKAVQTGEAELAMIPVENTLAGRVSDIYHLLPCLLYTSPSPRDKRQSRMPSSA